MTDYLGYNINDYSLNALEEEFKKPRYLSTYWEITAFRRAMMFVKERDIDKYKELLFVELVENEYIDDVPTIEDEEN